jgi:4-hydroxysphinganine ceramide fatty acyl 2-hydroxylase
MKNFRIDNKGSGRLFNNFILERLSRTHFLLPVVFYYFLAMVSAYYALKFLDQKWTDLMVLLPAGWIVFTLVEYLLHRFVFHFNPSNPSQEKLQYTIHGVHHEFPRDKDRLVMPPLVSMVLAVLFFYIFRLLFGNSGWLIFTGFVGGYSSYLVLHYAIHRYKPPFEFMKFLWRHHSLHHYHSTESAFGVSFPLWDWLFGTMPSRENRMNNDHMPDSR